MREPIADLTMEDRKMIGLRVRAWCGCRVVRRVEVWGGTLAHMMDTRPCRVCGQLASKIAVERWNVGTFVVVGEIVRG